MQTRCLMCDRQKVAPSWIEETRRQTTGGSGGDQRTQVGKILKIEELLSVTFQKVDFDCVNKVCSIYMSLHEYLQTKASESENLTTSGKKKKNVPPFLPGLVCFHTTTIIISFLKLQDI